jgi:hypothetical protein
MRLNEIFMSSPFSNIEAVKDFIISAMSQNRSEVSIDELIDHLVDNGYGMHDSEQVEELIDISGLQVSVDGDLVVLDPDSDDTDIDFDPDELDDVEDDELDSDDESEEDVSDEEAPESGDEEDAPPPDDDSLDSPLDTRTTGSNRRVSNLASREANKAVS